LGNAQQDLPQLALLYAQDSCTGSPCTELLLHALGLHQELEESVIEEIGFAAESYETLGKGHSFSAELGNLS
jgi:hypothetical protein